MKCRMRLVAPFWAMVCVALAGCGGTTSSTEYLPKGEGNIPIGRAQGKEMGESAVTIWMSDRRIIKTFTQKQTVYSSTLPFGPTTVTVTPANRKYSKYSFNYIVGPDQKWAFNTYPVNRVSTQVLKGFEVNFREGETFHVGERFDLETEIYGENLEGLKIAVMIDGGTAEVDSNDDLLFTKPGTGRLKLELLGLTRSFEFSVEP